MPDTHFANHLALPQSPRVRPHGHTLPLPSFRTCSKCRDPATRQRDAAALDASMHELWARTMGQELWPRNMGYTPHGFANHHWTHLMQTEAKGL